MTTLMAHETAEAPRAIAAMLHDNVDRLAALGERLRAGPPPVVVTCARGSSDHAATYGKYLIETLTGVPVASAAPSVVSLYGAPPQVAGGLMIAISQSGRSPDLLATVKAHAAAGAHVVALVNDEKSPLAEMAMTLLPLRAGPERAVAATKSCLTSLAGLAAIAAAWSGDATLTDALAGSPDAVIDALRADWTPAIPPLIGAERMFVLARGYGLGIAQEAALKLKETSSIQAEAFSAAEVRHGPMRIVDTGFPILGFATSDDAGDDVAAVTAELAARGAVALTAGPGRILPINAGHPAIEPLAMLAGFYRFAEALALARGHDPDRPPHLAKITRTL